MRDGFWELYLDLYSQILSYKEVLLPKGIKTVVQKKLFSSINFLHIMIQK